MRRVGAGLLLLILLCGAFASGYVVAERKWFAWGHDLLASETSYGVQRRVLALGAIRGRELDLATVLLEEDVDRAVVTLGQSREPRRPAIAEALSLAKTYRNGYPASGPAAAQVHSVLQLADDPTLRSCDRTVQRAMDVLAAATRQAGGPPPPAIGQKSEGRPR